MLVFYRVRFIPLFGLGTGWFYYLLRGYAPRTASHLNPLDPLFARHAAQCAASLLACAAWAAFALAPYRAAFGTSALVVHYLAPIFVFASWLVVTTFLHHQVSPSRFAKTVAACSVRTALKGTYTLHFCRRYRNMIFLLKLQYVQSQMRIICQSLSIPC